MWWNPAGDSCIGLFKFSPPRARPRMTVAALYRLRAANTFQGAGKSQIWNLQIVRIHCLLFLSVSRLLLDFPLLIHCCIFSTKQGQGQDSQQMLNKYLLTVLPLSLSHTHRLILTHTHALTTQGTCQVSELRRWGISFLGTTGKREKEDSGKRG